MSRIAGIPGERELADVLAKGLDDLPALPAIALKLLELTQDEESSVTDMVRVVETDPAIMARLLRMVNSAAYGFSRQISSLRQSIVILGFDTVRRLALGIAMHDTLVDTGESELFDRLLFWRHCMAVASVSRALAIETGRGDPEEAYVAGLLHDLGKPLLENFGRLSYSSFLGYMQDRPGLLIEEERRIIGLGHDVVGAAYGAHGALPERLVQVIHLHHQPLPESIGPDICDLVALVALADFIAWSHGFGSIPQSHPPILQPDVERFIDLERLDLTSLVKNMDREVQAAAEFYNFHFPDPPELRENILRINLTLGRMNSHMHYVDVLGQNVSAPALDAHAGLQQDTLLIPHHSLDQEAIISETLEAMREDLGLVRVLLFLLEPERRSLRLVGYQDGSGIPSPMLERVIPLDHDAGGIIDCLRHREPRALNGDTPGERALLGMLDTDKINLIPVIGQRRVMGILVVDNGPGESRVEADSLSAAGLVAHELGLALEHAVILANSRYQARVDALTGLPNRAELDDVLEREVSRARRERRQLAAAMLDIDHFKRFNDTFGHAAGDTILKIIGKALRQTTREGNFVGRYGGEEFTAILPGVSRDQAFNYCERLRRAIEKIGRLLERRFPDHPLTVSIGVAVLEEGDDAPSLLGRADEALYRAKQSGRNRVVW
ncbi:MAG: HDOD domain-containing protein [Sedimenticola sp.]